MAKPSWVTVSPTSGSKNANISISASAHTGRSDRSGTVTVSSTAGAPVATKTCTVTQSAKAEFITVNTISKVQAAGQSIFITGTSNAASITIGQVTGATTQEVSATPTKYSVNDTEFNSGSAITGDPGAAAQYQFKITYAVPANSDVTEKTYRFTIKTPNTTAQTITITQSAAAPTLTLSKSAITLVQAGTAQSVSVTSNTSWSVS